jgi:glycerophosphoryl diester phosphodiesterase
MREAGTLESHFYTNLDRTEVIPKILFAFKAEIQSKQLATSRLVHLFRLRNQAVHFKASSTESLKPTVEELLGIWQEMGPLLELVNGAPTRQELTNLVNRVASTWFA